MLLGFRGQDLLLTLVLADGDATRFPRARVYDDTGSEVTGSPFDLAHVANGLYQDVWVNPDVEGHFSAIFIVYNDAGHTVVSNKYDRIGEAIRLDVPAGAIT